MNTKETVVLLLQETFLGKGFTQSFVDKLYRLNTEQIFLN